MAVSNAAHEMKSAAGIVGANRLAAVCTVLETAGEANDIAKNDIARIEDLTPDFSATFTEVIDFIQSL